MEEAKERAKKSNKASGEQTVSPKQCQFIYEKVGYVSINAKKRYPPLLSVLIYYRKLVD